MIEDIFGTLTLAALAITFFAVIYLILKIVFGSDEKK